MKLPSPAQSCLIVGLAAGAVLWLTGERTFAIVLFAIEAVGWAGLYAFTAAKDE